MTGSVPTKLARLAGYLTRHPGYAARYIVDNFVRRGAALDLALPWISYEAIDFLDGYLAADMAVFEYGSGGSTLFFAQRAQTVVSVEDTPGWYRPVRDRLDELSLPHVDLRLIPLDLSQTVTIDRSDYVNALAAPHFDVILVDGTEKTEEIRPACFDRAEKMVKAGGIIVVDDSWRYSFLRSRNRAKKVQVFQSVGPARFGVTSTDVFFY